MPIAPVGFHNCTVIWRAAGATRDATFQIGIRDMTAPTTTPDTVAYRLWSSLGQADCPAESSVVSDQWTFKGVSDSYTEEAGVVVYQYLADIAGDMTSKPVPVNGALLVKKNTASGGRRNRGRLYCPPVHMDEGTVDAIGNIAPATLAIIGEYWSNWMTAMLDEDLQPVLFHGEAPFTPTVITSLSLQPTLATQRRRMRK